MSIPWPYTIFFLYIEPISALAGAYYAAFEPKAYLNDLALSGSLLKPTAAIVTTQTNMALTQLANLYLLFALNEYLVLSSTNSIKTWKRMLVCLLVADFGHLATMAPLGLDVYCKFWEWNTMIWGSVGFVYLGASMRLSFLGGFGLREGNRKKM